MTPRPSLRVAAVVPAVVAALAAVLSATPQSKATRVSWRDVAPVQATLRAGGISEASFDSYVARVGAENVQRVRGGDLNHLVFFVLQSSRSPRAFHRAGVERQRLVDSLHAPARTAYLGRDSAASPRSPGGTPRITALLRRALAGHRRAAGVFGELLGAA